MVTLRIRDVPEEVRDRLVDIATSRGQSLQAYLLALVKAEAARSRNGELIRQLRATHGGSTTTFDVVNELKYQLREERERQLLGDDYEER